MAEKVARKRQYRTSLAHTAEAEHLRLEVARKLRELRKTNGLSQEALAARAGIDPKHLQSLESGKHDVKFVTLLVIAQALSVEPPALVASLRLPQFTQKPEDPS